MNNFVTPITIKTDHMPLFTTSISLIAGTDQDYDFLSRELQKKSFRKIGDRSGRRRETVSSFSSNKSSLLDVNSAVNEAAAHTGKKFTYSVMKEKSA
jgi:hypothetical protein